MLLALPFLLILALPAAAQTDAEAQPDAAAQEASSGPDDAVMVIHGGAGGIRRGQLSPEREARYRAKLREALETGYGVLQEGRSSLDAVEEALTLLESSPLFNAGRGAVFTNQGTVEHDASIMEGTMHNAGAVAGVKHIRHPIQAARLVMDESKHVMLAREGAEAFAEEQGLEPVPNDYFYTEERRRQFLQGREKKEEEEMKEMEDSRGPRAPRPVPPREPAPQDPSREPSGHYGTVGAVALDQDGTLAAGTSTGGLSNKRWGRIGDSPIIGAGTYADDATCAVSSTGTGEYFIRGVIPHDIASMMRYADASVQEAARAVVLEKLPQIGDGSGTGGVIALDAEGHVAMPFNTPGMFRGYVTEDGEVTVYLYGDEGAAGR